MGTERDVNIDVTDGVVQLRGAIADGRECETLRIVSESAAAVKTVVDHLIWVERLSGMAMEPRAGR